ncbi:hypothetical protein HDG37_006648 [Paraburkholderia sp. MM5384-R2]|nr:hypothetical protein [Paraburkholderia sp. MM5384-R2]
MQAVLDLNQGSVRTSRDHIVGQPWIEDIHIHTGHLRVDVLRRIVFLLHDQK